VSKRLLASLSTVPIAIALVSLAAVEVASQATVPAAKQTTAGAQKKWTPPRTADGRPDLQGLWTFATLTPLERPRELAGKQVLTDEDVAKVEAEVAAAKAERGERRTRITVALDPSTDAGVVGFYNQFWLDQGTKVVGTRRTSLIVDPPDGRLPPYTPQGKKKQAALMEARNRNAGPEDRSLGERCILGFNAGPPMVSGAYNNHVQLLQTPGYVGLLTEMVHSARIVPMDGRPHGTTSQWSGDSRGRWEGDTLVIDTTNFRDDGIGAERPELQGTDKNLHVVERFTRVDADTLLYEFTVDDPTVWTKPWTASMPMTKAPELMFEYACHEGNYSMTGILAGARAEEKAAGEATKKVSK
jgi:hypothetical protein